MWNVCYLKFKSNSGSEMEFERNPLNSEWCTTQTRTVYGHQNAVLTRSGTFPAMLQLLKLLELIFHNGSFSKMSSKWKNAVKFMLPEAETKSTLSSHKPKVHCTVNCHFPGTQTAIKRHASAPRNKRNSSRTGSKTRFWLSFVLGRENFSL